MSSSDWNDDDLRDRFAASIAEHHQTRDEAVWTELASRLAYVSGDYRDPETFDRLAELLSEVESAAVLPGDPA